MGCFFSNVKKTDDNDLITQLSNKDEQLAGLNRLKQTQFSVFFENLSILLNKSGLETTTSETLKNIKQKNNIKPSDLEIVLEHLIKLLIPELEKQELLNNQANPLQSQSQWQLYRLELQLQQLQQLKPQVNQYLLLLMVSHRQLQQEYMELKLMYPED